MFICKVIRNENSKTFKIEKGLNKWHRSKRLYSTNFSFKKIQLIINYILRLDNIRMNMVLGTLRFTKPGKLQMA